MAHDWQKSEALLRKSANRGDIEAQIARIASRQKQLISLEQLTDLGLSARAIQLRCENGRLHRIHAGIHALHPPPYSRHQLYLAATYACGPGSVLSDLPAAGIHGIFDKPPLIAHVTNRTGSGRSRAGIVVHRRDLDRSDLTIRHGIPCTSLARTILDCSRILDAEGTEDLLMAADSIHALNRHRLEELVAEHGSRHLRPLISDDPRVMRSRNERRLFSICREFEVSLPQTNYRIDTQGRTFYADFCWPELHLIVEADSWRWHGGRLANESDKDRDQLLALAGWRVIHFTRDQILRGRAETGRRLLRLASAG